jgi:hypothetical protein
MGMGPAADHTPNTERGRVCVVEVAFVQCCVLQLRLSVACRCRSLSQMRRVRVRVLLQCEHDLRCVILDFAFAYIPNCKLTANRHGLRLRYFPWSLHITYVLVLSTCTLAVRAALVLDSDSFRFRFPNFDGRRWGWAWGTVPLAMATGPDWRLLFYLFMRFTSTSTSEWGWDCC